MNILQEIIYSSQSDDDKIDRLIELLQDEISVHNANEEGMPCDQNPRKVALPEILRELRKFDVEFNMKNSTVSKQGVPIRKL